MSVNSAGATKNKAELQSSRIRVQDDLDAVCDLFHSKGYTDGLPIIPPTEARVRRMLSGTTRNPALSLGKMPPLNNEVTIEKIAVNAVMAGCRPEYMPVLITAVEIMLEPQWALNSVQTTTNPLTPMIIVSGPVRDRIGVNCGAGAMGPGWQANSSIGRATRLILLNIGGATPGDVDKCTQGFVGKFGMCVGENEEESAWEPYHVSRGFKAEDNVVTVVAINASTNIHDSSDRWEDVIKTFTASLISPGTANIIDPLATPFIAFNPLHSHILNDAGFSRTKLQKHFFKHSTLEAEGLSKRREVLRRGEHGTRQYLVNGSIPLTNEPNRIHIIVTGSMSGGQSCFLPNGGYGFAASKCIGN